MQNEQLEYAGFWARTGACIVDGILFTLVSLPLWIPTAFLVPGLTLMVFAAFYRSCVFFHPTWIAPESEK